MSFLEVRLDASQPKIQNSVWHDSSDAEYFRYQSSFGSIQLRRRTQYPATFANIEGSKITIGYGELDAALKVLAQPLKSIPDDEFISRDFLCISIDTGTGRLCVQRDALCTMPLFIGRQDTHLVLCNDFARVCRSLDASRLTVNVYTLITQLLDLTLMYDNTLFDEISSRKRTFYLGRRDGSGGIGC